MRFHNQNTHNIEFKEEMIWNEKSRAVIEEGKDKLQKSNYKLKNFETLLKLDWKGGVNNYCDGGEDKSRLTPRSRPASHWAK